MVINSMKIATKIVELKTRISKIIDILDSCNFLKSKLRTAHTQHEFFTCKWKLCEVELYRQFSLIKIRAFDPLTRDRYSCIKCIVEERKK